MKTTQLSIVRFILLIISFGLSISALRTIVDLWHRRDIMQERQTELNRKIEENDRLAQQLKEIGSEEYTEKVARNTLGLVKDGESIVILPGAGSRSGKQTGEIERLANWQKWWELFF